MNEGREELDVISRMDSLTNRGGDGPEGLRAGLVWIEDRFSHSPAAWVYAYWATLLAVKLDDRRH